MNAFYCGQDTTMCKSSACVAFNKVTARQTDIKHDKAGWWYGTWKMRQTKKCSQAVTKTWTEMTASVDFVFVYASNYLCVQFFCFQNAVEMLAQLWSLMASLIFVFKGHQRFKTQKTLNLCACVRLCVPHKRCLGNYWSHHHQTWPNNCLRHDDASHVNYIDLDWRLHGSYRKIRNVPLFHKLFKQSPSSLLWR